MGRGKVAEKSKIAHFRIDVEHKESLEAHAKSLGKKFSGLARDAIEQYVEVLQEEQEIQELKRLKKYEGTVSAYERAKEIISKGRELVLGRKSNIEEAIDLVQILNSYIEEIQSRFSEGVPLKRIHPEVLQYIVSLNVGVARQYLIFHRKMAAWSNRMEATKEYIGKYTTEFSDKVQSTPEDKEQNRNL